MKIIIETIPHGEQRYPTVGDWIVSPDGGAIIDATVRIAVSRMGDWRYEALVAVHEVVEAILCLDRGITQDAVDEFDTQFEMAREPGDDSEPGDSPAAPYQREHGFATSVERLLAAELRVDWAAYEQTVNAL